MTLAMVCEKCHGLGSVATYPDRPERSAGEPATELMAPVWHRCSTCHGTGERPR